MSGAPPPYPLKATIGGAHNQHQQRPSTDDNRGDRNGNHRNGNSAVPSSTATGRLRLPPPLPPVKGSTPLPALTGAGSVPLPGRPPMGRLTPLHTDGGEHEGGEMPGAGRRSPAPRFPVSSATPPPDEGHEMVENGNGFSESGPSTQTLVNPLNSPTLQSPSHHQQQPSPSRKATDRTQTPSGKTRKMITPSTGSQHGFRSRSAHSTETVETLCPLQTQTRPVERFFVEFNSRILGGNNNDDMEMDEDALLFDRLAEYTDDDSFFSSGSSVIEQDPRRLQKDLLRDRAVRTVYDTLNLRALTHGRTPQELEDKDRDNAGWLYQVHQRAIALHHSSFFIFPPGMTARVVVYNVMHHWLMELLLLLTILGYSIFTACWARYNVLYGDKPHFMVFADFFYTVIYGIDILARLFASGFILHPRAYFRSPWHWLDTAVFILMVMNCTYWRYLWNFTAFRLIRIIKSCTYVPMPIRMKLLARSVLRSTCKLFQVSVILIYALFFFALIGLQLFRGVLHHRCVNSLTDVVTKELCRPAATGQYWFYWGNTCATGYDCIADSFPNPHYDFRNFDDIGHALLSTFQIMTFQGWTSLLQETNDAVATLAILYYVFTILICAWFIPSLYVGVFVEKIEKTSRLFVQKQLQLFDAMLLEQRQRMTEAIKLRDFVERDKSERLRRTVQDLHAEEVGNQLQNTHSANTNGLDGEGGVGVEESRMSSAGGRNTADAGSGGARRNRTKWTNEQRVQLHLSLTRQRDIAEQCERKRRMVLRAGQANGHSASETEYTTSQTSSVGNITTGDFALGGRVGMLQHHPLTYTIGAAHGTKLPLAVRLENEQERLQFLKNYQSPLENEEVDFQGSAPRTARGVGMHNSKSSSHPSQGSPLRSGIHHGEDGGTSDIVTIRESAGIIPSRRGISARGNRSIRSVSPNPSAATGVLYNSANGKEMGPQEVLINDPEGGDFRYATTCGQRWNIIRNILHVFTEGYPRILTQYLWEHKRMQRRFGLVPFNYVNKYEEAALRKLRQKRSNSGKPFNEDKHADDSEMEGGTGEGGASDAEKENSFENLSPIRMARNIIENAPVTFFKGLMLFFVFANGVFNASRHHDQPDYWDDALFVSGVCFTSIFMLEHLIRIIALGPGPFVTDVFNIICFASTFIGFFELGFGRSNVITLLNWIRFLRLFCIAPFLPMRRVTRVLLVGFQDIVYALILFSVYMFMWVLIGMSFFGGRITTLNTDDDDYSTWGFFDTFSHAMFAVAQAYSYDRDEWLYMSWNGMRVRGGYTIMYFMAVVGVAFIFRYLFIAVFAWAWQREEEEGDFGSSIEADDGNRKRHLEGPRLRWFDFTVWRSFKHIHGGFERRDVAPDEVFHLNQDMRRQLRIAEAKERLCRQPFVSRGYSTDLQQISAHSINASGNLTSYVMDTAGMPAVMAVPQFVNVGGQLQRQMSMPSAFNEGPLPPIKAPISQFQAENAQLRFARRYSTVPATTFHQGAEHDVHDTHSPPLTMSTPSDVGLSPHSDGSAHEVMVPYLESYPSINVGGGRPSGVSGMRGSSTSPNDRHSSVTGHFSTLGYDRPFKREGEPLANGSPLRKESSPQERRIEEEEDVVGGYRGNVPVSGGGIVYEHVLLPGPRLRYKHAMAGRRRRFFERCLDCNTHKQMPLRAPPNVQQRTADELHAEHCHMAAVRSSRQLILNVIMGYVRLQKEIGGLPTREAVETVLGQAWSCGMLLFESIEYLSCADIEVREHRTWDRTLEALQLQQWLLGLHVGEEQVGRATLAYILAHKKTQESVATQKSFKRSWRDRSFFVLSPNNPVRLFVSKIVESKWFEWFVLFIIFAASICLCFYNPRENQSNDSKKYLALHILDDIFAVIFGVEMILKWIHMGVILDIHKAYFWHRWNMFDCFITIISLIAIAPKYSMYRYLKVMRCFKILGPLRYCSFNRNLSELCVALWDSVPTLANILLLCLMNYIIWSIIAVRMFMGLFFFCSQAGPGQRDAGLQLLNKSSCELNGNIWKSEQRNFNNFYQSLLTMFEVSTGSKWLDVIYSGVDGWSSTNPPIVDHHQAKGLFFIAYYYFSHLILFSFFISSLLYYYFISKNISEGINIDITFEHQLWIRMQRMILQLKPHIILIPLKNKISHIFHKIIMNKFFEIFMGFILFCNLITMSWYWYGNSQAQEDVLDILQYIWVAVFTIEIIMRLTAHGLRAFSQWSFSFHVFITCLSYLQIGLNTTSNHQVPFNVNVLRLLYFDRLLKFIDFVLPLRLWKRRHYQQQQEEGQYEYEYQKPYQHLHLLYEALVLSSSALINVTLIFALGVFVFAVLGMHLIGPMLPVKGGFIDDTYNNFMTFPNALMMVFRLSTLEDWVSMLRSSLVDGNTCPYDDCHLTNWAPVFYVPIVICFFLMIITLYMAVIVDHYVTVVRMKASVARIRDLHRFRSLWSMRDPNATLVLKTKELPELLEALRPPLGLSSRNNRVELLRLLREYQIPDHAGKVHYYEVLLPLARRVLAMAFSEDEVSDGATFEAVWRLSENSLRALPTVLVQYGNATTAQHFAASYVQAAYRRDKACRHMHQVRANLWREARTVCDDLGLPYNNYGFGSTSLDAEDPRKEAARRGLSVGPTDVGKKQSSAATGHPLPPATFEEENNTNNPPATRLPGLYQPAIEEKEKRFGPDVPNAVRRHETRSEKLRRKEEERQQQQQLQEPMDRMPSITPGQRSNSQRLHSTDYQPPLGTDPTEWLQAEIDRRASAVSTTSGPSLNTTGLSNMAVHPQQPTAPPS